MLLAALFFICEILDINLNKSTNFGNLIAGYALRWRRSKILFFITQFTFIYLSFLVFALGIQSFLVVSLYLLYAIDVAYKVYISDMVLKDRLDTTLRDMLHLEIPLNFRIILSFSMAILLYLGV